MWQQESRPGSVTQAEGRAYCDMLTLGGYSDWRLATLAEERRLIRGGPATVTDGACALSTVALPARPGATTTSVSATAAL